MRHRLPSPGIALACLLAFGTSGCGPNDAQDPVEIFSNRATVSDDAPATISRPLDRGVYLIE